MTLNDVVAEVEQISSEAERESGLGGWHVRRVRSVLLKHMGEVEFASWDCRQLAPSASRAPARVLLEGQP